MFELHPCSVCSKKTQTRCSRCKTQFYCSRECQASHYKSDCLKTTSEEPLPESKEEVKADPESQPQDAGAAKEEPEFPFELVFDPSTCQFVLQLSQRKPVFWSKEEIIAKQEQLSKQRKYQFCISVPDSVSLANKCTMPVKQLKPIFLNDLYIGEPAVGKILWLEVFSCPIQMVGVYIPCEDQQGVSVVLVLYNYFRGKKSTKDLAAAFPVGTRIGVMQPYLKHTPSLRCDHASNIIVAKPGCQPQEEPKSEVAGLMEKIENLEKTKNYCELLDCFRKAYSLRKPSKKDKEKKFKLGKRLLAHLISLKLIEEAASLVQDLLQFSKRCDVKSLLATQGLLKIDLREFAEGAKLLQLAEENRLAAIALNYKKHQPVELGDLQALSEESYEQMSRCITSTLSPIVSFSRIDGKRCLMAHDFIFEESPICNQIPITFFHTKNRVVLHLEWEEWRASNDCDSQLSMEAFEVSKLRGIDALRLSYMDSNELPPESIFTSTSVKGFKIPELSNERVKLLVEEHSIDYKASASSEAFFEKSVLFPLKAFLVKVATKEEANVEIMSGRFGNMVIRATKMILPGEVLAITE